MSSVIMLFLMLGLAASAQVTVVPKGVTTDTLDIFSGTKERPRSAALAMATSLLLPGSGHQYVGRDRSALVYLSVEAASIFAFFFCDRYASHLARSAAGYAWTHAGAQGSISGADDHYWKLVGNFMDVAEYNTVLTLNRMEGEAITDENSAWHWDDESSRDTYNEIRNASRGFHVVSTFFIGALLLNRVAAFIDIRTSTRDHTVRRVRRPIRDLRPVAAASSSAFSCALTGSF